jgi:hypothetical protein
MIRRTNRWTDWKSKEGISMKRGYKLPVIVALLIVSSLFAATSGGTSAQDATPTTTASSFPVQAIFVNAMTNYTTINIYVNGSDKDQRVVEDLKYGTASPNITMTSPTTEIIIKEPKNNRADRWLFQSIIPTGAGNQYVITVSDQLVIPIQADISTLKANETRARVVHAANQAPTADIYVNNGVKPAVTNLRYGMASETGQNAAGSYDIKFNQTGTSTTFLDMPGLALDAGQVYTLILIGTPGSTAEPLTLLTVAVPAST